MDGRSASLPGKKSRPSDMDDLSRRLDQIDSKLDKLSDAVSRLAMIEERITHQTTSLTRQDERSG